jgi:branched-chain amino acid transport system substrate-binding protein
MQNKIPLAIVSFAISVFILISACAAPQATVREEVKLLKIGWISAFSGPAANWGLAAKPIVEAYEYVVNEAGGIKVGDTTYKIEVISADGQFLPAPGAAAARKLIYDNGVNVILGYNGTGYAAISPITNQEKVIFITRTGSVNYDPARDPYVVFGLPSAEITMNQMLAVMEAYPQYKVLCWTGARSDERAAESIMAMVDQRIERDYGIKSVRVYYPEGTTNFTPYITMMAERGAQVVFAGGTPLEIALLAKQRWEMGHKWPLAQTSPQIKPELFISLCGYDAAQGVISDFPAPWVLNKVKVAPKYLAMAEMIKKRYIETKQGPLLGVGIFAGAVGQMAQYFEALQQAGTINPDSVMKVFRGGTFETFLGKYTLSGQKTYLSPVVFGYPCAMGQIKGKEIVYIGESPLMDADKWYDYFQQ